MASPASETPKNTNATVSDECVLLIGPRAEEATRILGELDSATGERFRVKWVTDLSRGIESLHNGGVGAVVVDMALLDSQSEEAFDELNKAAPDLPILILSGADIKEMARLEVRRDAADYPIEGEANSSRLRRALRSIMDRRTSVAAIEENGVANVTLDSIGEAVLRTDLTGNVTYLNRMAESMTGWGREEALGSPVSDVLRMIDGVSGAAVDQAVATAALKEKAVGATITCNSCKLVRRDGVQIGIEHVVTLIHDPDASVTGSVVTFHDVSEARAASLEMSHSAQHDVLTNLPNRILFNDRLTQSIALAKRQGKQLAVLFVDLDHFKKINDSLGHAVGDQLLQSVAERLLTCVRQADTVSRLGGDEFVVLLSQVEQGEDAAFSARKILRVLGAPHLIAGKSLDINVSIGGSTYPNDGQDAGTLMDHADAAMYEAKQRGRNNYQFFRRDMHMRVVKRLALEGDLRYALGREEFLLHYQPKVNLETGQISGVEALLRWKHPQQGTLPPSEFVPIAEECGLILSIGRWVLLEACRQARRWRDAGIGIVPMSVNVSAAEFGAKDFISAVRAVLISTGVEPENLELELTESVLMQDAESAVVTLIKLKAMGVRIAIDDFGTGYSSFTYLRRFPVDALKLDHTFVHEITAIPGDSTIVSAMINLGRSLKQRVIAEGIETRSQLNFLQSHKCDEGQGYLFSRPVVAQEAGRLIKTGFRAAVVH